MKPAILFLEQQSWRGGAQCVLEEVLSLVAGTYEPVVAFPQDGPFAEQLRRSGLEVLLLPLGNYRSGRKGVAETLAFGPRSLWCAFRLARIIKEKRMRCVYINGPRWLPAGVLAARLAGVPSLFHLHLCLTRRADILLTAHAAAAAHRILACSQTAADVLLQAHPRLAGRLQVVYNPVPRHASLTPKEAKAFPRLGRTNGRDGLVVGIVGRITPEKGHHRLLQAVSQLANRLDGLKVIVVGAPAPDCPEDARYFESLQAFAERACVTHMVEWAGRQTDLRACYARLDILAIPSTFGEGLPLVVLEAMQNGVPVLGSQIGGIPELVRDGVNGMLVPPGDVGALAAALRQFHDDPALRRRLRAGASATIDRRFASETFQCAVRQVIHELCAPGGVAEAEADSEPLNGVGASPRVAPPPGVELGHIVRKS